MTGYFVLLTSATPLVFFCFKEDLKLSFSILIAIPVFSFRVENNMLCGFVLCAKTNDYFFLLLALPFFVIKLPGIHKFKLFMLEVENNKSSCGIVPKGFVLAQRLLL